MKKILYGLLVCSMVWWPFFSMAQQAELVMGVFPRQGAQVAHQQYDATARYLSAVLERTVRLETAKSFDVFWNNVEQERYDLVHYNQYHYVKSHAHVGYKVILRNEELGKATIASVIAVRKDSGFTSVADLKGKRVIFGGGRTALMGFIGVKALLAEHGLQEGDYQVEHAVTPLNAVIAVALRQADAAGTGDVVLSGLGLANKINVDDLMVLAKGPELPQLPWAVRKNLPDDTVNKIRQAMEGLDRTLEGRRILADAGVTRFVGAQDSDYHGCRELVAHVLKEKY